MAADEFLNSDLVIKNIEEEELGLFLAVAADKDRLREFGLSDFDFFTEQPKPTK